MRPFRYERGQDAGAPVELESREPRLVFLAGATNLVDLMKLDVERPDVLVDVTQVPHDRVARQAKP